MSRSEIERLVRREIATINAMLAEFRIDAGVLPRTTTVAGSAFVAYGLLLGRAQRIHAIERILPELSERISAGRQQPTPLRLRELPLAIEAPHPSPRPLDWSLSDIRRCASGAVVAGRQYIATGSQRCTLHLDESPHILIAGSTGSGKSTLLRMLAASAAYNAPPDDLRLALVDLKNSALPAFAATPHVDGCATKPEAATQMIAAVLAELRRRVEQQDCAAPRLLLLIDELAQLPGDARDDLQKILSLGREMRIHVIAATQHPSSRLIGGRANYAVRLVGRTSDATTAELACGRPRSGAWLLPGNGAFLLINGAEMKRIQAFHVTADTAQGLAGLIADRWRNAVARPAVVVRQAETPPPALSEVERIARAIDDLRRQGASKSAMCRHALNRPYAGSYAAKIDQAIEWLERKGGATTTFPFSGELAAAAD